MIMQTLTFKLPQITSSTERFQGILIAIIILLLWLTLPHLIRHFEPTAALLDTGIWQLIVLSLICFTSILTGSWWLLQKTWQRIGLPDLSNMVSQFKNLALWQQLAFYWASFALLLLAGIACIAAVI